MRVSSKASDEAMKKLIELTNEDKKMTKEKEISNEELQMLRKIVRDKFDDYDKGFLAGQKGEQERSIKLCNKCKPYQEGQNSQKEKINKEEFMEIIHYVLNNTFVDSNGMIINSRTQIGDMLELTFDNKLKQKIKGEK